MLGFATTALGRTVDERLELGRSAREHVPRASQTELTPVADRPNPIDLLREQGSDRLPNLLPYRYGRMATSPFAFLRGSALVMAQDLAATPRTGFEVQACGDAHLVNFGVFATPERNTVLGLNDFDETLPGPWEWDIKRLAASLVVAARHRRFAPDVGSRAVLAMTKRYATALRSLASMGYLEVRYARLDVVTYLATLRGVTRTDVLRVLQKARSKDHLQAQAKLTVLVDGRRRIVDAPPLIQRVFAEHLDFVHATLEEYRSTLDDARQHLLARYVFSDAALKVVGVGSAGTRCFIALFHGRDDDDPLFLQIKEAHQSVLAEHLAPSVYANQGERVVQGQRLTQAASDIFLGWTTGPGDDHRHFYWRQLHDVKGSVDIEVIRPSALVLWGEACGAVLARAHARTGDAAAISGYLGGGTTFGRAMVAFAEAYADQTERDHALLVDAIAAGTLPAVAG